MRDVRHARAGARRLTVAAGLCFGAALLASCAYYNSMYYAKRYAGEAERAERAGRTAEATDRWRQAALHADSQVSRHPRSRWTNDALLIRGRAAIHQRDWSDAVVALERAIRASTTDQERHLARLYLAEARIGLRLLPEALTDLDSALLLEDERPRSRALYLRGRAARSRPGVRSAGEPSGVAGSGRARAQGPRRARRRRP